MIAKYFESFYIGDSVTLIDVKLALFKQDFKEREDKEFIDFINSHPDFFMMDVTIEIENQSRDTKIFQRMDISVEEIVETIFQNYPDDNILSRVYQRGY